MLKVYPLEDKWALAGYYAARSTLKHHLTGAVICGTDGRFVAAGWSHHTLYNAERGWTQHAEHHAIERALPKKLNGCSIYVVTITKFGYVTTAKPCTRCQSMLESYGLICYHS